MIMRLLLVSMVGDGEVSILAHFVLCGKRHLASIITDIIEK